MITLRRTLTALTGLFLVALSCIALAPTSLAQVPPPDSGRVPGIAPAPVVSQITYGSPIWLFVLVAAAAIACAVAVTTVVLRQWRPRAGGLAHA